MVWQPFVVPAQAAIRCQCVMTVEFVVAYNSIMLQISVETGRGMARAPLVTNEHHRDLQSTATDFLRVPVVAQACLCSVTSRASGLA